MTAAGFLLHVMVLSAVSALLVPKISAAPMPWHPSPPTHSSETDSHNIDVLIYAATPAGIGAALSLAKLNSSISIVLIEPNNYVGGMASPGGIGLRDHQTKDLNVLNSTELEWAMRNAKHYGVTYPVWQPDSYVGQANFRAMLAEYPSIRLELNTQLLEHNSVRKDGTQITAVQTEPTSASSGAAPLRAGSNIKATATWWNVKHVIDASYEGDLAIAAGATTTFGRESRETYNESLAGITDSSIAQFQVVVDAAWKNGSLLKYVMNRPDPRQHLGQADDNVMAYSFRVCLTTNTSNQAPITPPDGYKTEDFELAKRHVLAELAAQKSLRLPWGNLDYYSYPPKTKFDACCGSGPVGIDAVGLAVGYSNGTRAQRQEVYDRIRYYVQGLMWFWAKDPNSGIPDDVRKDHFDKYGLCKDEFPENGHFPPQLYVREASRLVGDRVFTQNDRIEANTSTCRDDSIGLASWGIDIHEMQRVPVQSNDSASGLKAFNEGLTNPGTGGVFFYELPYWTLLPKRADVANMLVPNCPSVSHVAFSSIRVEPTLWRIGQAAGSAVAAALAAGSSDLHQVDVKQVQERLHFQGVAYHYPIRPSC